MKIGNLEIKLAEKAKRLEPSDKEEIGGTGTTLFSGSLSENEYNSDLRGSKGLTIYDKMRRSDSRVKFALAVCELPLRAVSWVIEPASDDEQDEEIAQALQTNLFNMSITWDSFLHHVLLMLPFGFSVFEKVWEIQDGQVRYRKLAPRLPSTVYKWYLDANGGLEGIQQATWINEQYKFIEIPVSKLVVFTNDKEGSNYEGISILRTAYKHWYYKDNLYRIDGIAAERHALGIPTFNTPTNAGKEEKARIDEIGQRLYAQEQAFVRLAEGYEFDVKGLSGTIKDIMPSIQHHDKKIAESVLADFIDLGAGDKGSWALSKDKSSFFLMALKAVATNIQDTMNAYAIPQWVDYNYPNVTAYPKLKAGKLETRNMIEYANAVTSLINSGAVTADNAVEDNLRDILELPPLPEDEPERERAISKTIHPEQTPPQGSSRTPSNKLTPEQTKPDEEIPVKESEIKTRRDLTEAEKKVAFEEISKELGDAENKLVAAASAVQKRQIDKLTEVVSKVIEKRDLAKLDDIDVPFRSDMAKVIEEQLLILYKYGRAQVKRELTAKLVEPPPIRPDEAGLIAEFLRTRSKANSNLLATKLKSVITFEALRQIKEGILDKSALLDVMKGLSDKELIATAQYSVGEAFNWGRSAEAEAHSTEIARAQYSALLDDNTCPICGKLDGQEWDYEDERTTKYASGNPECEGGGRCRCMLIYIGKSERRNE